MKRKLIAVVGVISPLFLVGCTVAVLLSGTVCWFLLGSEQQSQIVRIIPVAPLATMPATLPETNDETTAAEPPAPVEQVAPPVSPVTSVPANIVEEVLGFALPVGSVNSVTQEGVATRVVIAKIGVDAPVLLSPIKDQTWQVDHLGQAVGHLEGTAPPGSSSNIVLAGHVTLAKDVYGPFAGLGQLTSGDTITVYYGDQPFNYLVDTLQSVDRTAIEVTYPSETGQITLITCNNWSSEEGRYIERLIVKGHLVNQ